MKLCGTVITGADYRLPAMELLFKHGWFNLKERRYKQRSFTMFKNFELYDPGLYKDVLWSNIMRSIYGLGDSSI